MWIEVHSVDINLEPPFDHETSGKLACIRHQCVRMKFDDAMDGRSCLLTELSRRFEGAPVLPHLSCYWIWSSGTHWYALRHDSSTSQSYLIRTFCSSNTRAIHAYMIKQSLVSVSGPCASFVQILSNCPNVLKCGRPLKERFTNMTSTRKWH